MTRGRKILISVIVGLAIAATIVFILWKTRPQHPPIRPVSITGAVVRDEIDPRKQLPVAGAEITVTGGMSHAETRSDGAGLFQVMLRPGVQAGEAITLQFKHSEYKPLEMTEMPQGQLFLARMKPLTEEAAPEAGGTEIPIKDIRVRYSVKFPTTVNVSSAAKSFQVVNTGGIPCNGRAPCSPDGKWKASIGSITLDAGEGNEFRNARVSCLAGPCPFTRIESENISQPSQILHVSVRNWSDTTTFLVEAEVTHTMAGDMVRQAFPVIFGQTMNFTLPALAEGPSIEADVKGVPIVFPLGPALNLSWATCELEVEHDGTRIYRCALKPGYTFANP